MGVGALSVAGCASDDMKSMNDPMMHDSMMKEWVWKRPIVILLDVSQIFRRKPSKQCY
jgi:hypothetical protein